MYEILVITIIGGIVAGVVIAFVQFFLNLWLKTQLRKRNLFKVYKQMTPPMICPNCNLEDKYNIDIAGGFAWCPKCGYLYSKKGI